jgi:hypothetical protein
MALPSGSLSAAWDDTRDYGTDSKINGRRFAGAVIRLNLVGDLLAVLEAAQAGPFDCTDVHEHILSAAIQSWCRQRSLIIRVSRQQVLPLTAHRIVIIAVAASCQPFTPTGKRSAARALFQPSWLRAWSGRIYAVC